MPPARTTIVGTSGTHNTLKPLLEKMFLICSIDVLLPPHGPPVIAIL